MAAKNTHKTFIHTVLFMVFLLVLSINLDYEAQAINHASTTNQQPSKWQLETFNQSVRLTTQGSHIANQMAVQTLDDNCQTTTLKFQLAVNSGANKDLLQQELLLNLQLGTNRALIRIPVARIYQTNDYQIIEMDRFIVNQALQRDLMTNQSLSIEVLGPQRLIEQTGFINETFELTGFNSMSGLYQRLCISKPNHQETNYALAGDVL